MIVLTNCYIKVVYIGDTIHRNVNHNEIRTSVAKYSNNMCDSVSRFVQSTKTAAINFPSIQEIQLMVRLVFELL